MEKPFAIPFTFSISLLVSGYGHWLLFLSIVSFPYLLAGQVPFQNPLILNTSDGLPHNNVTAVAEDEAGFAWIGTLNGLARFDGSTVESFTHNSEDSTSLPGNVIHNVLPDISNGRVWVATNRGLSSLDLTKRTFTNYRYKPNDPFSSPDHQATDVFKDSAGDIWIGFREGGLIKYRPETDDFEHAICTQYTPDSTAPECRRSISKIQEDPFNQEILWLCSSGGLLRFNKANGVVKQFNYAEELEGDALNYANSPTQLLLHPNGKIYYGTWYQGLFEFDRSTERVSRLSPCYSNGTSAFSRNTVTSFRLKSNDEFWINSVRGLQLYRISDNCITSSFKHTGNNWYSIEHVDQLGRIWSASRVDGFRIFNPLMQQFAIESYEPADSPRLFQTRKILEDTQRNRLIVVPLQSKGIYVKDLRSNRWKCIPPPTDYPMVKHGGFSGFDAALLDNGEVLVLGNDGLFIFRHGASILEKYPLSIKSGQEATRFRNILHTRDGLYWISGYRSGLLRLDAEQQEITNFKERITKKLGKNYGGDHLVEDARGNIWMREHNGLMIYDKAKEQFIYHEYNPDDIRAYRGGGPMTADADGGVWIASRKHFLGYGHADSLDLGLIRTFGKEAGLIGEKVWMVKAYRDKLLVFTDQCIQLFDPNLKRFERQYELEYGLGDYNGAATELSNGQWAVGKKKAIAYFLPDSLRTNIEPPKPYVSSFSVFDKTWQIAGIPEANDSIKLKPNQNYFSFEFSAIAYNLPQRISYRYKLEGFDEDWIDGTKRKFAAYTNVPGGHYRFLVDARNSEGVPAASPSATYLYISTVWYKTTWFQLFALVLIFGAIYSGYRYKVGQVRKEERLRSEYEHKLADIERSALRAQMNPHFIFNALNSIEYFIISNESERASEYLNRFSRLIRLILQNSRSKTVSLKDDLEALKLYIEIERMRFDNIFAYELKMETSIDPEKITVPSMLLQPYVENAIWHGLMQKRGGNGKLLLRIQQQEKQFLCIIEDNGTGREAARKLNSKSGASRKSYGMKITSDRLAMLNKDAEGTAAATVFDLRDESGKGIGTRIELSLPLL